ncbi:transcription factor bHLH93 [Cinnamomum micranthum f. kanehirae]|uniref:Transcription factor bHLH93 n=1 Tax=Cinnamomum micranthum f. kanehirae TaxID=337451 RepID=A0A3S3NE67_9MAGN|nr:transcription factor bHLH93 [Cinnamomum micranthum f. kanehirae]
MELEEHGFLEELLGLRREAWENFSPDMSEFFTHGGCFDSYQENPSLVLPYSSLEGFASSSETAFDSSMNEVYCPYGDGFSVNEFDLSSKKHDSMPCVIQEDCPSIIEDENLCLLGDSLHNSEKKCKVELAQETKLPAFDIGNCLGRKNKAKKLNGQPSKNLMAERRRRKRLNDRLSMLRSVVPKISKMDRTSILGDTIDYMKELLDRIKRMKEEIQVGANQMDLFSIFNELKSNEILVRNTPKFDVERRNTDTRLEICCAAKPGLLLSTVTTLEALGLEIQQCVISCFNDFGMQASCSEEMDQRAILSSEDIKQALFRNAGYGGRCM